MANHLNQERNPAMKTETMEYQKPVWRLPGVPAESLMNRHNIVQEKNAHVVNGVPHYEGNTTQELQSIVDNAGLTAEYEWIKNGLE
jgi:hypothetical protein